jgi:hypothetical protein
MKKYIKDYKKMLDYDNKYNEIYKSALHINSSGKESVPNKMGAKTSILNKKFIEEKSQNKHDKNDSGSFDSVLYLEKVLNNPEDVFLVKFNDYSDKFGVGYTLSNGTKGMLFNDKSNLIQTYKSDYLFYIERIKNSKDDVNRGRAVIIKKFLGKLYPEFLYKKCALFHHITNEIDKITTPFNKQNNFNKNKIQVKFN